MQIDGSNNKKEYEFKLHNDDLNYNSLTENSDKNISLLNGQINEYKNNIESIK